MSVLLPSQWPPWLPRNVIGDWLLVLGLCLVHGHRHSAALLQSNALILGSALLLGKGLLLNNALFLHLLVRLGGLLSLVLLQGGLSILGL